MGTQGIDDEGDVLRELDAEEPHPLLALEALDLGAVLLRTTRLEPEQLEQERARQLESREPLVDILIEEGMLNADEVRRALADQFDLTLLDALWLPPYPDMDCID